jgi:hypothetical protein
LPRAVKQIDPGKTSAGEVVRASRGSGNIGTCSIVGCSNEPSGPVNYARRQQYRRLRRAVAAASCSAAVALLALLFASAGTMSLAVLLLVLALGLGLYARHWGSLAARTRVGARSEDQVQRALAVLEAGGWRLRHSLRWLGPGDIDSVALSPTGIAVVIETKTRTYEERHLDRVRAQAAWLVHRRRRSCRNGTLAVLCLVRTRGVQRVDRDVLVVSIDQLIPALRRATQVSRRAA